MWSLFLVSFLFVVGSYGDCLIRTNTGEYYVMPSLNVPGGSFGVDAYFYTCDYSTSCTPVPPDFHPISTRCSLCSTQLAPNNLCYGFYNMSTYYSLPATFPAGTVGFVIGMTGTQLNGCSSRATNVTILCGASGSSLSKTYSSTCVNNYQATLPGCYKTYCPIICKNGGTCSAGSGGKCSCPKGWTGADCSLQLKWTIPPTIGTGCPLAVLVSAVNGSGVVDPTYSTIVDVQVSDILVYVPVHQPFVMGTFNFTVNFEVPNEIVTLSIFDGQNLFSVNISVVQGLELTSMNYTQLTCTSQASASVSFIGGAHPQIRWGSVNNPALVLGTGRSISGLTNGSYYVEISDTGCDTIAQYFTISPLIPRYLPYGEVFASSYIDIAVTPVTCAGGSDGTMTVTATHGQPPYWFQYGSDPPTYNNVFSNLTQGSHSVTVGDSSCNNLVFTVSASVPLTPAVAWSIYPRLQSPISCVGGQDAIMVGQISGGTSIMVHWSSQTMSGSIAFTQPYPRPFPQPTFNLSGLPTGFYEFTATDLTCATNLGPVYLQISNYAGTTQCRVPYAPKSAIPSNISVILGNQYTIPISVKDSVGVDIPYLPNNLNWTATSSNSSALNVSILFLFAKAYVQLTAIAPGSFSVSVKYNGVNVLGSAMSVTALRIVPATADLVVFGTFGFVGYDYGFQIASYDDSGNLLSYQPEAEYAFFFTPAITHSVLPVSNGTFKVQFTPTQLGNYSIQIVAPVSTNLAHSDFVVQIIPNPWSVPPQCEIFLGQEDCDFFQHSLAATVTLLNSTTANISAVLCCGNYSEDLNLDGTPENAHIFTDYLANNYEIRDPLGLLIFAGDVPCPDYTTLIAQIPKTISHFSSAAVNLLTLCQINSGNQSIVDEFDYACSASFAFRVTPTCPTNYDLVTFTVENAEFYVQNNTFQKLSDVHIALCCGQGYTKQESPKAAYVTGQVYTYTFATDANVNSAQSVSLNDLNSRPLRDNMSLSMSGQVSVLAISNNQTHVTCTFTVTELLCSGDSTTLNGTVVVDREQIMNNSACAAVMAVLNNQTGDTYFSFVQNMASGKIETINFSENELDLTIMRVNFLKLLDLDIVPTALTYVRSEKTRLGKEKSVRWTKVSSRTDTDCWSRAANASHYDHAEYDSKVVCLNSQGLSSITLNDTFSVGQLSAPTTPPIQEEPESEEQRLPTFLGRSSTKLQVISVQPKSNFDAFRSMEFYTAASRTSGARSEPLHWEGFTKRETPHLPDEDAEGYVIEVFTRAIGNIRRSSSFIDLKEVIAQFPEESVRVLRAYLHKDYHVNPEAEQVIFGAMAASFSPSVELLFLDLMQADVVPEIRKEMLIASIALVPVTRISDNLLSAVSRFSTTLGHTGIGHLSVIAGQLNNANDKRSEKLIDIVENSLNEHEITGNEEGIVNSINALGNTRSRRSLPHLRKYLHPEVNSEEFEVSDYARSHMNKMAARSLRAIPGEDVNEILFDNLEVHTHQPDVHTALLHSLSLRDLSPEHEKRLRNAPRFFGPTTGNYTKTITRGDTNAKIVVYADLEWNLVYENSSIAAYAGIKATLFGNDFKIIEAAAVWGSTGLSHFAAFIYLDLFIPNPFGAAIPYSVLNWFATATLPILENTAVCGIPPTVPSLKSAYSVGQTFFLLRYLYGIPLIGGISLNFEVTGGISVDYGYKFIFQGRAINPSLSTTQFRTSLVPGGFISAQISAKLDVFIAYGSISADVTLVSLRFPITVAMQLDGSTACYGIAIDSTFLDGSIILRYKTPCIFRCKTKQLTLFEWTALKYTSNIVTSGCCGINARETEEGDENLIVPEELHDNTLRAYRRQANDPRAGTVLINDLQTIVNFVPSRSGFAPRVQWAKSQLQVDPNGHFPANQGGARATGAVQSYLGMVGRGQASEYRASDNAGHILGAQFGGDGDNPSNFFVCNSATNREEALFEDDLHDCLEDNPTYFAIFTIEFSYLSTNSYRPDLFKLSVEFFTVNGTGSVEVPKVRALVPGYPFYVFAVPNCRIRFSYLTWSQAGPHMRKYFFNV